MNKCKSIIILMAILMINYGNSQKITSERVISKAVSSNSPNCVTGCPSKFKFTANRKLYVMCCNKDSIVNYTFKIINRNGEIIFMTNDKLNGWDGKINGQKAPKDKYMWQLTGYTPSGKFNTWMNSIFIE